LSVGVADLQRQLSVQGLFDLFRVGCCLLYLVGFAYMKVMPNLSPEHPPSAPVRPHSRFTSQIRRCSCHGR